MDKHHVTADTIHYFLFRFVFLWSDKNFLSWLKIVCCVWRYGYNIKQQVLVGRCYECESKNSLHLTSTKLWFLARGNNCCHLSPITWGILLWTAVTSTSSKFYIRIGGSDNYLLHEDQKRGLLFLCRIQKLL